MLQPQSLLWHYLWLGPNVLQAMLTLLLWRRGFSQRFPVFFSYLVFSATEQFTLYGMDILPPVSAEAYWRAFFVVSTVEAVLVVAVIGELFFHLLRSRPMIAKLGSRLISGTGAALILLAVAAAAYTPLAHGRLIFASRAYVLLQSSYIVEGGLALFLFLFAAHFKLIWNHQAFGIALGFGIAWCEHMAAWAVIASGTPFGKRLDLFNMATYHVCVLIWFYFLLVPHKVTTTSAVSLPENNLDIWNRELERLLQQ